jgi:hypothetical protein
VGDHGVGIPAERGGETGLFVARHSEHPLRELLRPADTSQQTHPARAPAERRQCPQTHTLRPWGGGEEAVERLGHPASLPAPWLCGQSPLAPTLRVTVVNRRPQLELITPNASPQEAAAVVAALERFMRDTAPRLAPPRPHRGLWTRAAMLECVGREDEWPTAWGDPTPWE